MKNGGDTMHDPSGRIIIRSLARLAGRLQRRLLCRSLALAALAAAAVCLLAVAWERTAGLREPAAGRLLLLAVLTGLGLGVEHFRRRRRTWRRLALDVEEQMPELQDALICAAELETLRRPLRVIEAELLAAMRQRVTMEDILAAPFRRRLAWRLPLLQLGLALGLWLVLARTTAVRKGGWAWHELLAGRSSGIAILLKEREFPFGSDIRLTVQVNRWEAEAVVEVREKTAAGEKKSRFPLLAQDDGTLAFTLFAVEHPFAFRIVTPSLRSRWEPVSLYVPPVPGAVRLWTEPLAYTGRDPESWAEFRDISVVAGEAFGLEVTPPDGVEAVLRSAALPDSGVAGPRLRITPPASAAYRLHLRDRAGHTAVGPEFHVTVLPDLHPVVEVRSPGPDSRLTLRDELYLDIGTSDDYGVSAVDLHLARPGAAEESLPLYRLPPGERAGLSQPVSRRWDMGGILRAEGDVLIGRITVADNRQPQPQVSSSDLFFITLVPDENSVEMDASGQGQSEQASVSDLLAESKRLLRLTWDTLALFRLHSQGGSELAADLARSRFLLLRDLRELELEVRRRANALAAKAGGQLGEPLQSLFRAAGDGLTAAANLQDQALLAESQQPQQMTLAALTRIDVELQRNAIKSKKQSESGEGSGEPSSTPEQEQQKQAQEQRQRQQRMERLQKGIAELRRLIGRQSRLNQQNALQGALPQDLREGQQEVQNDTMRLRHELGGIEESGEAHGDLQAAADEMGGAASAWERSDRQIAGVHGERAISDLRAAERRLQQSLRAAGAQQLARLSDAAARLSAAQQNLAREAESGGSDPAAARARQEALRSQSRELLEEVREQAGELQEAFPETAAEMREAASASAAGQIDRRQTRAIQALQYRRLPAAAREQQAAANHLQELAQRLMAAQGQLPAMSAEDLRQMLQELQKQSEQTARAARAADRQAAEAMAREAGERGATLLQQAADALKNPSLQQLTDQLRQASGQEGGGASPSAMLEIMQGAATVLLRHLQQMQAGQELDRLLDVPPPPHKYRRQVEEYFRELGR